eukprot:g7553.t1
MDDTKDQNGNQRGVNVGGPAFCRRPFETKLFKPIVFQEIATATTSSLSEQLSGLPSKPEEMDLGTEDISFRNTFHRWFERLKESSTHGMNIESLKPKSTLHKERILKEPLLEFSDKPSEDLSLGVHSIVQSSGNALRSRIDTFRKRKRCRESERNPKIDPEEETMNDVQESIEAISEELHCAREMVAQRNVNLKKAPYRQNLFRMYWRIARYLEECEGRVFEEKPSKRTKQVKSLTIEQKRLIQERISELEERIASLQNCSVLRKSPSPTVSSSIDIVSEDIAAESEQIENYSALAESIQQDVVIDIQIVHPSFLKTKATDILALGSHSLKDVVDLCVCTSDNTMEAMEVSSNPRYVFLEGTFYIEEGDESVLRDIEGISSFCQAHKCGWSLDQGQKTNHSFEIASMTTLLRDIPLRASNKLLYLYSHQGACEHLLHIRNVRMVHELDTPSLEFGPIRTKKPKLSIRKCSICEKTVIHYTLH